MYQCANVLMYQCANELMRSRGNAPINLRLRLFKMLIGWRCDKAEVIARRGRIARRGAEITE